MRALLDVNVLVALFDPDHTMSDPAHRWLKNSPGIATSPLTENGLVRIICNPNYSKKMQFGIAETVDRLVRFAQNHDHEFWPDDVSLRDAAAIDAGLILGSRRITDLYLLALAMRHGGRLVTFDEHINLAAVPGARPKNLCVI